MSIMTSRIAAFAPTAQPVAANRCLLIAKKVLTVLAVVAASFTVQSTTASASLVKTLDWTQQGSTIPTSSLSGVWSYGTVTGTTASALNAGAVFPAVWGSLPFSAGYTTSTSEGVALGAVKLTIAPQTFSFSGPVSSLYLFFNYIDNNTAFDFGSYDWTLVGANHASRVGSRVDVNGSSDTINDGFIININESFAPGSNLSFNFINNNNINHSVAFNLGQGEAPSTVPEPSTYVLLSISLVAVGYARKRMANRQE
jgi:hypothetical protein